MPPWGAPIAVNACNHRPHLERTRAACRSPGEYLLIEDTTLLNYSQHPATEDLDTIGDGAGRGNLHSALAARSQSWTLAKIEQQYGKARHIWRKARGIPTGAVLAEMRWSDPPGQ